MKKILLSLGVLLAILLASVYLFIPRKLKIEATTTIEAALPGVFRSLSGNDSWKQFWPDNTPFEFDGHRYSIKQKFFNVFSIGISSGNDTIISTMNLLPVKSESLTLVWNTEQTVSKNPFKRFTQYRQAAALEKDMNTIITRVKEFMEQPKNIYGFDIKQAKVTDSVLISTRRRLEHQPTVKDVDDMIQSLKKYIAESGAVEKNSPMLNVRPLDSSHYEVMTAIPVDRELPLTKEFVPKFLLKGGNILVTEVRGGPHKIETGLNELENFRNDYKLYSPAIPYQLLITDRLKEQDTAKWVTRLYYPVS